MDDTEEQPDLNEDVLRSIFSYLCMEDKFIAMKACHTWRNLIQDMIKRLSIGESWCLPFCENKRHSITTFNEALVGIRPFDITRIFPNLNVLWLYFDEDDNFGTKSTQWFLSMSNTCKIECLQLNYVNDRVLSLVIEKCAAGLVHFKAEKSPEDMSSKSLSKFIENSPKLEILEFRNSSPLNCDILKNLNHLKSLKLNILDEECIENEKEEFMASLIGKENDEMVSIEICGGGKITLNILSTLFKNLTRLKFTLDSSKLKGDEFLVSKLSNLQELELFFLPDWDIENVNKQILPIFENCQLNKLTIDKADGKTISEITRNWPNLEYLKIDSGMDLMDDSVMKLSALSNLKSFSLSYAQNITDTSIEYLVRKCSYLNQLSLFYMLSVSENVLELMIVKAKSNPTQEFFCDFYDTAISDREYTAPENLFIDIYNQRDHSLMDSDRDFEDYMDEYDDMQEHEYDEEGEDYDYL